MVAKGGLGGGTLHGGVKSRKVLKIWHMNSDIITAGIVRENVCNKAKIRKKSTFFLDFEKTLTT